MREYLKNLRAMRGLSQQEVADKISISQNYYCYIENGERQQDISLGLLQKLSAVLEVPLDQLIEAENDYKAKLA